METKALKITELVLRDAHQSLLATRMKTEDMLPIAEKLDKVGFFSLEMWGGATFDSCLRFLNEDPWERVKKLKKLMPKMHLAVLYVKPRGQKLAGSYVKRVSQNTWPVFPWDTEDQKNH